MTTTDLTGSTPNIAEENIAKLKQIFPDAFEEGKVDFDKLKQDLGEYIDEDSERYNFTWHGKGQALRLAQTPSTGTLRPCKEESKNWDTTQNLYIEGDNLEVLKLLQKSYHSKVKMIYIDPPYNTGNDFVYPDDYKDNLENYLQLTGQVDEDNRKIGTNSDASGRYHTNWLNMMYPRLRLARNLLTDDGVVFISIDDNEHSNLKKACDEIFGEDNFITNIIWQKKFARQNDATYFSTMHDFILVYAKLSKKSRMADSGFDLYRVPRTEDDNRDYKNIDNDSRGPWNSVVFSTASGTDKLIYEITTPNGNKYYPPDGRYWGTSPDKFTELVRDNRIWFGKDGGNLPRLKAFLSEVSDGIVPNTIWFHQEVGHTQSAAQNLKRLFDGQQFFDYTKPVELIKLCSQISTRKNDIVLDFFSGSATTAHAVMQLNVEDGGNRKFIMVQLPEPCDENSEAYKAGYKNICEIGKERIRRAGEKVKTELAEKQSGQASLTDDSVAVNPDDLDIGFKVLKLDSSNLKKWNPDYDQLELSLNDMIGNYVPGRTELDVVYEIMLKYGLQPTLPVEQSKVPGTDCNLYSIGFGALVICLDDNITIDVANEIVRLNSELQPENGMRAVFKDNGFKDDSVKTNTIEILKLGGVVEFVTV